MEKEREEGEGGRDGGTVVVGGKEKKRMMGRGKGGKKLCPEY